MADQQVQVSRPLVGVIAVSCLAGGLAVALTEGWDNVWCGAFVRVGVLMGAFWLALPTRHREAAWANVSPYTVGAGLVAIFVVARWRSALPVVIAIVVIGMMLRPKQGGRRRG